MTDQLTLLKAVSFLAGNRKLELHQIEAFQKAWDGMSPQSQAEFVATWKGKPKNPDPVWPGNLLGPKIRPSLKPGDHHLIANDQTEEIAAYQADGKEIWRVPCLCRGQGSDASYKGVGEDTPPGLYKVGQVYRDYDQWRNPPYSRDAMAYGWFSLDLEDLEGQESGIGRAGIMIHGGGSACGWPGAWAPHQALYPTLGCIRMHNVDLRDKVVPLLKSGQIYVSVLQEKP